MPIREESFRIGCGRYLQKPDAVKESPGEILHFGKKVLVLGGKTALSIAGSALKENFRSGGVEALFITHTGTCDPVSAEAYASLAKKEACTVVMGVGGGVMMDLAKFAAAKASLPILNFPTSSATCAAYTPLSVLYTPEGKTIGSEHLKNEVNAVLADESILARQPVRLFLAGVFDAMAKFPEICHRYRETSEDFTLGLDYAYVLAKRAFTFLSEKTVACCEDLRRGESTENLRKAFFATIALPGVISGVARGSNQTALGHKFYETARTLYPAETRPFLHGEMVGVGLLLQNVFNGKTEENAALLEWMRRYGMPESVSDIGVPATEEARLAFREKLLSSSSMKEADESGKERLEEALQWLWKKANQK